MSSRIRDNLERILAAYADARAGQAGRLYRLPEYGTGAVPTFLLTGYTPHLR